MGKILLYYKYVDIEDPHAIKRWQQELCADLGLTGRILIGKEGINGTVGGTNKATDAYIKAMQEHPLFSDVDFKTSKGGAEHFPKLRVAIRKEIVTLGIAPEALTPEQGGKHLEPKEVHELLEKHPEDLVILDTRNTYESRIGTFKNAITPEIDNFRDFPEYIENNIDQFKDKQVLMFCTGGVRCERATAVLQEKGIAKEIYQIKGGIHRYAEQFPDGYFRGKNYVFDGRIAVKINDDILGSCYLCDKECDKYTNCVNVQCNLQYIACKECLKKLESTCSFECQKLVQERKVAVRATSARTNSETARSHDD